MNICPGCGGVLGRDCFDAVECQQIAASMNSQAQCENEQLVQEIQYLKSARVEELKNHAVEFAEMLLRDYEMTVLGIDKMGWLLAGTNQKYTTQQLYDHLFNPKV